MINTVIEVQMNLCVPADSWIYLYEKFYRDVHLNFVILLQVALFKEDKTNQKVLKRMQTYIDQSL